MTLGIIADDLTGALDSGLQLYRKGLPVSVFFTEDQAGYTGDVSGILVFDSESRNVDAVEAVKRTKRIASMMLARRIPLIYKKLDSTLRGNTGAEIQAILEFGPFDAALVAPTLPETGRIVKNGVLFVDEVPLADTQFSQDPLSPVTSSAIAEIVNRDVAVATTGLTADELGAADRDPMGVLEEKLNGNGPCIIVADAVDDKDLRMLANFVSGCGGRLVPCGSAGLLKHLAGQIRERTLQDELPGPADAGQMQKPKDPPPSSPILIISSSMSTESRRQMEHTIGLKHAVRVKPDEGLLYAGNASVSEYSRRILDVLAQGENVAVDAGGRRDELPRDHVKVATRSKIIQTFLADLVISVFKGRTAQEIGGLVVTGGETAITVSKALGAYGIRISGEIEPLVPAGYFLGGTAEGLPVVTKAGGFGTDAVLSAACKYLTAASR